MSALPSRSSLGDLSVTNNEPHACHAYCFDVSQKSSRFDTTPPCRPW